MKLTNLIVLVLFSAGSKWTLAVDRNPFERPITANPNLLWQLEGTVLTQTQKFAFVSHSTLGNYTLQQRDKVPQSDWWILDITPGAILLQRQNTLQTVELNLTERQQK